MLNDVYVLQGKWLNTQKEMMRVCYLIMEKSCTYDI